MFVLTTRLLRLAHAPNHRASIIAGTVTNQYVYTRKPQNLSTLWKTKQACPLLLQNAVKHRHSGEHTHLPRGRGGLCVREAARED